MQKPGWLSKSWLNEHKWSIAGKTALIAGVVGTIALLIYRPGWTGFGPDSTKSIERNAQGQITKTIEVEQSGKTLWDWLSVLGVPLSLAILGFWFQQREQKRSNEQAELEKEIAAANQREEALQAYFDRLSTLLVDKNLIAVAAKLKQAKGIEGKQPDLAIEEQKELLDAAVDVIRARTLSILRQFGEDGERKSSIIRFLIEVEAIEKLKLDLSGANLSSANLNGVNLGNVNLLSADLSSTNLIGTNLNGANLSSINFSYYSDLSNANLILADLSNANLSNANLNNANLGLAKLVLTNLSGADLRHVNLSQANLRSANLSNTNFCSANLRNANLHEADLSGVENWTKEQLNSAKLCKTQLPEGCDLDPDQDCQELESRVEGNGR